MGFEMLVAIERWRGFGSTTDFNGVNFETYIWTRIGCSYDFAGADRNWGCGS
jgi:hypothetical protein